MESREQLTWNAWGKRIAEARRRNQMTQTELADRLGVTQPTVSKWEGGTLPPDDASKFRLAEVLDRSLDDLFAWPVMFAPEKVPAR